MRRGIGSNHIYELEKVPKMNEESKKEMAETVWMEIN
jgi:hypothetical protein